MYTLLMRSSTAIRKWLLSVIKIHDKLNVMYSKAFQVILNSYYINYFRHIATYELLFFEVQLLTF